MKVKCLQEAEKINKIEEKKEGGLEGERGKKGNT